MKLCYFYIFIFLTFILVLLLMEILYIFITGIFTGLSSGMFGIGGSVIATPFLKLLLGLAPMIAIATPLPAVIPSAISGSIIYYKKHLIKYRIAFIVIATAIPLGWLGDYTTNFIHPTLLIIIKTGFLMILGLKFFISSWMLVDEEKKERVTLIRGLISGVAAGFLAGFLAIGGGIILVTIFVRVNYLQMKNAIATSLFCVIILAIFNSIKHYQMGHIDVKTALILSVVVIPFSMLGAKIAILLKNRTLERIFGIVMITFSILFIIIQLT